MSRVVRTPLALVAVGAGALGTGVGAGAAEAASVGGFGAFPVARAGQAHPSPYFRLRLAAGHATTVTAMLSNSTGAPIPFTIQPVAGLSGKTSGAVYGNAVVGEERGLQVAPADGELTLPAHTRRRVRVRVSADSSVTPGDHLAGIAFVDRDHPTGAGRFKVTEIVRVVIGVSVRVPGATSEALQIGRLRAVALGGTPDAALAIPVRNTGGLYCRPDLAVRLAGDARPPVSETESLDTILPGTSIVYPLPWRHALARGTYQASVTATGCGPARHRQLSVTVTTDRPAAAPGQTAPVTEAATPHGASRDWPLLAGVAVGSLLLGAIISRRRRTPPAAPPPAAGSTA